jgi:hypothetical protein
MKTRVAAIAAFTVLAAAVASASDPPNPAWDKLKSLVGTSLMERLTGDHDTNMITMYAPDRGSIVATHYCAAGNQPRMRAKAPAGDIQSLDFQFLDVTNAGAAPEIMQRLVVTFRDPNHFTQSWTSRTGDKDQTTDFVYSRKQ